MDFALKELEKTERKEIISLLASTLEGLSNNMQDALDFEQRVNFEKLVKSLRRQKLKPDNSTKR